MVSALVVRGLDDAGLKRFTPMFATLSDHSFLDLRMSDYAAHGIVELEDKQRLFRLIKSLQAQAPGQGARQPALEKPNALIDLDENDGDLLSDAGVAFQLSPLSNLKAAAPSAGPAAAPAALDDPPKIRVVVRKRPSSKKERERGDEDVVDVVAKVNTVVVNEEKVKVDLTKYCERHAFKFDEALDESVSNEAVYQLTVGPLVRTLFRSGRASCFAYGQTGSGKTYTMSPLPIRASADIFTFMAQPQHRDIRLCVSCFEIYGNKVFDLLNQRKKLNILEDGKKKVCVVGLKEFEVEVVEGVKALIEEAGKQRSTGSTAANSDSSRSHSIMQFALKRFPAAPVPGVVVRRGEEPPEPKLVGKISFIDLAGSERGADTFDNNRQTRLEGAEINKSLLALKECIRALDSDARHVPFRGSKLTAVLRDSFVGDQARTVMIANISPCSSSVEHTLNTLRYADRVKELRKDKADRTPGGVTPGDDAYYAAVARAAVPEPDRERERERADQRERERAVERCPSPMKQQAGGFARGAPEGDGSAAALAERHDELMDSILLEEESLVAFHRAKLEEDMETMRQEMALLQEVDKPGSEIDHYVEQMAALLLIKLQGVQELQAKLDTFKAKLKEEEALSRTVHKIRA
ncbi:Kinesin-like protein KIF2A [Tetrabaena socialis]|uniref:Kinesin-like protein n=1 Tax=Tetrabaena socialis TaxID=47790 RepID=A0A2J8A8G8_9CHLO|nr:Kinesin-like protein KIF2A [Tetrabaena socialis]|eukprot:PNH08824.1 Kinesin-like protein KIF2A [Tetrabaena socialis]